MTGRGLIERIRKAIGVFLVSLPLAVIGGLVLLRQWQLEGWAFVLRLLLSVVVAAVLVGGMCLGANLLFRGEE